MDKSEKLNEIFAALSKFQGELCNASKSKAGHNYKYADLSACINACKDLLAENGLAVSQMLGGSSEGQTLTTILTHSSGQYISDCCVLPTAVLSGGGGKNPVQCLGSSITYMRRYSYCAITGLTQEDEDAAGHVKAPKKLSPEMQDIINACSHNDNNFVKANWKGSIAKNWGILDPKTIDKLNSLIKL
jgi:hypothetical protein